MTICSLMHSCWLVGGSMSDTPVVGNNSHPQPCYDGYFCPRGSISPMGSGPCPTGYYCPSITKAYPCPKRHYCPGVGNIEPLLCYPGTYSSKEGQTWYKWQWHITLHQQWVFRKKSINIQMHNRWPHCWWRVMCHCHFNDMINVLKYACFGSELKILPRDWFSCDSNFFSSQTYFHLRTVRASGRVQEARNSEKTVFGFKALITSWNGVTYYFRLLGPNPYITWRNIWRIKKFHVRTLATPDSKNRNRLCGGAGRSV